VGVGSVHRCRTGSARGVEYRPGIKGVHLRVGSLGGIRIRSVGEGEALRRKV
jgi:hypothetical protein